MLLLPLYGAFVLVLGGGVNCAVRRSFDKKAGLDSQPAPNIIELDALDPRNQAISSSYSIVETSGGSSGPNRVTYTKREFEPTVENTEHRPSLGGGGGRTDRRKKLTSFRDEDEPTSKEFPYDGDLNTLLPDKTESRERKPAKPSSRPRSKEGKGRKASTPPPKSINEIVEKAQPLQPAGSSKSAKVKSSDLSKSGSILNSNLGDGFEEGYDKEKHYDKEGGKKFIEAHKSEAGEKAKQGFKKEEGYEKAEKENHGKEEKKAVVSEKEGEKKGHLEEEKQYGEEYKGNEGEKGISVTKKGGHKKGHKKSGFHKVHHKDEYKKDEVFYDEEHDGDEHEEHAHEHEKHAKEKGGQAKKTSLDSGYHEGHGEKKGLQDKGHHYAEEQGHKKEAGQEQHHDQHSEFGKKGGVKEGGKYGHAEGGSHGGGYSDHGFF